jgi:signal transduction histidine kinase
MSAGETAVTPPINSTPAPEFATPPATPAAYSRILIVDDEPPNVLLLERILARAGGFENRSTTDPLAVVGLVRDFGPDLILLDLHMPGKDGFAVMAEVQALLPPGAFLPIIVLTADATARTKLRALDAGATDFLTKPLDHAEVLLRIRNKLHTRRLHAQLAIQNEELESTVRERTTDLRQALAEVKEMQTQLIRQERLSAFGTMAGGVAHDFNNALSVILGYSEMLLVDDQRLKPADREQYLRTIITAAKDSATIIGRLREFYRPSDERDTREHVDFAQLAAEAVALTQPRWKAGTVSSTRPISVVLDTHPVAPVSGNAAELRELLTNLIFNAVDAMPEGGAITVAVRPEEDHVIVQVADEGTGMDEETRARCLEPFLTTKGEAGTGLGLAMVYGIAQRHHATMDLQSRLGEGTTFTFSFQAEKPLEPEAAATEPRLHLAHALRILVVDDQPFICEIHEQYLFHDGHSVLPLTDPRAALDALKKERFDLLVTDQEMPELDGPALAAAAREIQPDIRTILLTGYGREEIVNEAAIDRVVGKPASIDSLREAIAEVFAETAAP